MRQGRSSSVGGRACVVRAGGQGRTRSEGEEDGCLSAWRRWRSGASERRCFGQDRTGNLQRWKVKAGSTTSSSYVLADRKGLDDFPAARPLTEPLWSFELRFEEKYGLAGGFSGNLGAKESHSPSTPPGPSGTASLRLSPGGIPSCPVHSTFVRPVLSGRRRVPSTLSVLSQLPTATGLGRTPGRVFRGRRLSRVSSTNARPTSHHLFTTVLHHQPVDHRCHVCQPHRLPRCNAAATARGGAHADCEKADAEKSHIQTPPSRRVSRVNLEMEGRYRLPHWA